MPQCGALGRNQRDGEPRFCHITSESVGILQKDHIGIYNQGSESHEFYMEHTGDPLIR